MTTEMTYRKLSVAGASPIGMMIALFDTLAGDFRRAADAIRSKDIAARCHELNHAAYVLGHLESWLDRKAGGESAAALARFYAQLRAKILQASAAQSAPLLEEQIAMILHVRAAWQRLDELPAQAPAQQSADRMQPAATSYGTEAAAERIPFSQSA